MQWGLAHGLKNVCQFDSAGVAVHGVIDFIAVHDQSQQVILMDWKTGKSTPENFQLEIYYYVASLLWPTYDISVWYYMIDRKRSEKERQVIPRPQQEIREEMQSLLNGIENEKEWPARPDWKCRFCDYRDKCPAGAEKEEIQIGTSALSALVEN